jgi:hypothetical protein
MERKMDQKLFPILMAVQEKLKMGSWQQFLRILEK